MAMRDFFTKLQEERGEPGLPEVRLAVYDSLYAPPQVHTLSAEDFHALVGELAARTYSVSRERGGRIPYVVIREIVENLIHAFFKDAVITILDDGNTIRISDQGPGIRDKERAMLPGFTTATGEMREYIKGVGSGLPVAREQLAFLGGAITIEDNLETGTVVTMTLRAGPRPAPPPAPPHPAAEEPEHDATRRGDLSSRQKKVLLLIAEMGSAGPSTIARELGISHSTAYRELTVLETLGYVDGRSGGRRTLTEDGIKYLGQVFKR